MDELKRYHTGHGLPGLDYPGDSGGEGRSASLFLEGSQLCGRGKGALPKLVAALVTCFIACK